MGKVVLVTGVSRDLGRKFARTLAADWNQLTTAFTALTEKP